MKLIIDIPEGIYKHVDIIQNGSIGAKQIINSVKNGIPAYKAIPSVEPTDVDETLRILDAINSSGRLDYSDYCELHDAISMISVDKDEWVKRSDVLRIIDKRVDERLSEPYKGMTNGEVLKAVFPNIDFCRKEFDGSMWVDMEDIASFRLDWWNSLYEPQESEE